MGEAWDRLGVLGMGPGVLSAYTTALAGGRGIVVHCGRPRSGVLRTLRVARDVLERQDQVVFSIEVPGGLSAGGVNRIVLDPLRGLDFECAIRATLRQDVDAIVLPLPLVPAIARFVAAASQASGPLVLARMDDVEPRAALEELVRMDAIFGGTVRLVLGHRAGGGWQVAP